MWMLIFLLLPLVGLAYAGWHVYTLLPLPTGWRWVIVGLGVLSFLLIFLNFSRAIDRMPLWLARTIYDVANSSIFVLLYIVIIFLVLDLGRLFRVVPREWLCQNQYTSIVLIIGVFVLFLYANVHYRHKHREQLTLTTEKPLSHPLRLVMASDLHVGYHNTRQELSRWVDLINAEHPDLVLIAGDIIDISVRPLIEEDMAAEFRRIQAPVYACLGNHEYYAGHPAAQQFYRDAGIHLLRDTAVVVGDLLLIGRDDRTNPRRKPLHQIVAGSTALMASHPSILLDHQPHHLEEAEQESVDFQFSGHTHEGQVWPISWITHSVYECAFGSYQRGHTRYYVSSGLGIWGGKFRIGTRSEYIVMDIR